MLNFSPKLVKSVLVLVITSGAVFAYSDLQSGAPSSAQISQAMAVTEAVKVENISQDYARAHMELMKQADELPVKSF